MGIAMRFYALWCLLGCGVFPATERPPHELYDAINSLRIDPAAVYHLVPANRIELRRGDALLSFEEGTLALFSPVDGRVTGAVFTGRGHALAIPRDPVEKQQMGHFLGTPVLDEEFISGYLRFTDRTADELLQQFQSAHLAPSTDSLLNAKWESVTAMLNPLYSLRVLFDLMSPNPKPFFYGGLEGVVTGLFDVTLDSRRDEAFVLGQYHKAGSQNYYDVWTSHRILDLPLPAAAFRGLHYAIETSILPDNSLDATTSVRLRAETGSERMVVLQLSRALSLDRVSDEQNSSLVFFQNEGMNSQERFTRGNNYVYVVLALAPTPGQEFTLRFHYRGNVIQDAGNGVLFVGARENWYPHLGTAADFAAYDLSMRWPRKLRLIATGAKLEEHEDGDSRAGHWKSEKPLSVAGFNLGEYASSSFNSAGHSIDVYANRQLEQDLKTRLAAHDSEATVVPVEPFRSASGHPLSFPMPPPSPADALKQLGKEIDSSIRFFETFNGPFPVENLSVSQIPGTFGQGWPGLLYISTYSFLPPAAQEHAGLTATSQEHFTELVPYHEVAHQWWGNVVGWSSYRDQWINEAIANYLALLFADTKKNPDHKLHVWLARYRQQLVEKSPGASEPAAEIGAPILGSRLDSSKSPDAYEQVIYSKGAWIVHMLRTMLRQPGDKNPDARFAALLQRLVAKYAFRALSTDDLQREVEAVMTPAMDLEGGHSMEWFFAQWVRGTGIPHYRVEFTAQQTEKGYLIKGKLFQTGVPRSFIARVPLYAGGAAHSTVVTEGPETSFHFLSPTSPRKLAIDPQMTLLCTSE
jgi:hypothetical protein